MTADKKNYLSNLSELLKKEYPANRTINIVCHGHSVPTGYFKTPFVDTFNAYPHLLHRNLKKRHPNAVINVIVTGIGGENSPRGSERFEHDALTHNPDLLTIDYALNDRGIGLENACAAWTSMIEKALARNIKIILLTPTGDLNFDIADPETPLNKHAAQIRMLAAKYEIGLADSQKRFEKHARSRGGFEDLMSQFNHPNAKGHKLAASELLAWFPA